MKYIDMKYYIKEEFSPWLNSDGIPFSRIGL